MLISAEVGETNLKCHTRSKDMHSNATDLISICESPENVLCCNFCIYLKINFYNLSKYILFLKFNFVFTKFNYETSEDQILKISHFVAQKAVKVKILLKIRNLVFM